MKLQIFAKTTQTYVEIKRNLYLNVTLMGAVAVAKITTVANMHTSSGIFAYLASIASHYSYNFAFKLNKC